MKGGSAKPITVITAADLRENGGEYLLMGGPALPVTEVSGRLIEGGPAVAVYPVSDAQVAAGKFSIGGGEALPVVKVVGRNRSGPKIAIPVHDPAGAL